VESQQGRRASAACLSLRRTTAGPTVQKGDRFVGQSRWWGHLVDGGGGTNQSRDGVESVPHPGHPGVAGACESEARPAAGMPQGSAGQGGRRGPGAGGRRR
jgi:hypothetical protein